jgi:hypothetical protein
MPALFTTLGILLIVVAIPFGLMLAPLALGLIFVWLGWRHVSASWQAPSRGSLG